MPLPAGAQVSEESEGARLFREREERQKEKERKEKEGDGKPKREEWMLVPPKEMDLLACEFVRAGGVRAPLRRRANL